MGSEVNLNHLITLHYYHGVHYRGHLQKPPQDKDVKHKERTVQYCLRYLWRGAKTTLWRCLSIAAAEGAKAEEEAADQLCRTYCAEPGAIRRAPVITSIAYNGQPRPVNALACPRACRYTNHSRSSCIVMHTHSRARLRDLEQREEIATESRLFTSTAICCAEPSHIRRGLTARIATATYTPRAKSRP